MRTEAGCFALVELPVQRESMQGVSSAYGITCTAHTIESMQGVSSAYGHAPRRVRVVELDVRNHVACPDLIKVNQKMTSYGFIIWACLAAPIK
jgi:hypothetical protein